MSKKKNSGDTVSTSVENDLTENLVKKSNDHHLEKKSLPFGIKQPTTVGEFRNNLKKYFWIIGDELYVQQGSGIKINDLDSLTDLYDLIPYSSGTPEVSVKVNPIKDFTEFMIETNQVSSFNGYFLDENNYEIIKNQNDFLRNYNPKWIGIDNQIYREFFILTLGDFSGYSHITTKNV